jgi:uncharacterized protein YbdZ (MbtH family)
VGRSDDQIKIRGHRIEPAEVESALLAHPAVASAVVTAREDPLRGRQLVAHVSFRSLGDGQELELRRHMEHVAPDHLRPDVYVTGPAPTLTAHGKVDRSSVARLVRDHSEDDTRRFHIVVNHFGQHSVWEVMAHTIVPDGWLPVGFTGTISQCLERIEALWPDIRPVDPAPRAVR